MSVKIKTNVFEKLKNLKQNVSAMASKKLVVGLPEGWLKHNNSDLTLSEMGFIHEFGSFAQNIPARPFLVPAIKLNSAKYKRFMFVNAKKILVNSGYTTTLKTLGVIAVGDVQTYMVTANFVALKSETIRRKGSTRPLIDSGQLRQSITYKIL